MNDEDHRSVHEAAEQADRRVRGTARFEKFAVALGVVAVLVVVTVALVVTLVHNSEAHARTEQLLSGIIALEKQQAQATSTGRQSLALIEKATGTANAKASTEALEHALICIREYVTHPGASVTGCP